MQTISVFLSYRVSAGDTPKPTFRGGKADTVPYGVEGRGLPCKGSCRRRLTAVTEGL